MQQCHYCWLLHASDMYVLIRRAKLGQIQGGLQRASQDSTNGGLQYFFYLLHVDCEKHHHKNQRITITQHILEYMNNCRTVFKNLN